jgi:myo-inositol 2-dehydrogenase/D-chiro-inositol 1-dehydrogenase
MSAVRIGIYGAGQMGATHARSLAAYPDAAILGVADSDEARARATASAVGATPCADLDALLALRLDAVIIAVPNVFHAGASVTALERGVHVFCEKPMATTLEDARRVHQAVERTRRVYQMGFNRRFSPAYAGLRATVAGGLSVFSGTIKMNDGDMRTPSWFANPAMSGGFIYDTGIHLLDLASWVLGPIAEVRCLARSSCYPDRDDAVALLRTRAGALVTFSTCGHAGWTAPTERVELFGDHASVVAEGFERLIRTPGLGRPAIIQDFGTLPYEQRLGYAQEERAFLDAVAQGRAAEVGADDALRAIELVDALYRSADTDGASVRVA